LTIYLDDGVYELNALVTGGAGFIGSHIVDQLLEEGHHVRVLDNFTTGRPKNLEHQQDHPRLELTEIDIVDTGAIAPLFTDMDWVFHIAARADIVPSIESPIEYFRANVDGTLSVVEASRNAGVKRFVYAASASCYGIPDVYPTPEDAPIRPQYPYALTKWLGEQTVLHWGQVYGMPVLSVRFFNAYGPRSRTSGTYGAVMGVFLAQKLAGEPFTIVGDGKQTRDFTYVTDVADACVAAARSDVTGEVINVGSGGTYSVNRLAELLGGDVIHIPERPGEPKQTFADTRKIERLLGWKAGVPFEDGVQKVLEAIDYWREAPLWTPDNIADATEKWFRYLGTE
jgi:UDP-glucose 4-epimerase